MRSSITLQPTTTLREPAELVARGLAPVEDLPTLEKVAARYAIAVTPEVAALIDPDDPLDPIARQYIPSSEELVAQANEKPDPIGDDAHSPVAEQAGVSGRDVHRVGVIGTGTMATGIAEVFAKSGFDVVLRARSADKAQAAIGKVRASLEKAVVRGKLSEEDRDATLARITPAVEFEELATLDEHAPTAVALLD